MLVSELAGKYTIHVYLQAYVSQLVKFVYICRNFPGKHHTEGLSHPTCRNTDAGHLGLFSPSLSAGTVMQYKFSI